MTDNVQTVSPQSDQDLSAPAVPIQIKKPNIGLIIVLVVLLLGVGGAIGYFVAKNPLVINTQASCTMESKICPDGSSVGRTGPKCEFTPCPSTLLDSAANWKTYSYEKNNFSFKYPPEYSVEERAPDFLVITVPNEHVTQGGISIESKLTGPYASYLNAKNIITTTNTISETKISGMWEIFQGVGKDGMLEGVEFRFGIAPYKTGAIKVETLANTQYVKVFDQILSSFKFSLDGNRADVSIIKRNSTNDYSAWQTYSDPRGYIFKYPSIWFLAEGNAMAQQVQNWDPSKVKNPGLPMSGNDSKWDINFNKIEASNISEVLLKEYEEMKVERTEKSKTMQGDDIYFIQGTGSFFGNEEVRVSIIKAIIWDSRQYYIWSGAYGGENNLEILKQVVESTGKIQ